MSGVVIGVFVGIHLSDKLTKSRVTEGNAGTTELDAIFRTDETKFVESSEMAGILAISNYVPYDIPTNKTIRKRIENAKGSIITPIRLNHVKCSSIEFDGTFEDIPYIMLESTSENVRVTVEEQSSSGFKICVIPTSYELYQKNSIEVSWIASDTVIAVCDNKTEYKCQSGECIKRSTICNAHMDCLSGDDESSILCHPAVTNLLMATFFSTAMITYLVSFMMYIKNVRMELNHDREDEEIRLADRKSVV